jgi:hypothetical protein
VGDCQGGPGDRLTATFTRSRVGVGGGPGFRATLDDVKRRLRPTLVQ